MLESIRQISGEPLSKDAYMEDCRWHWDRLVGKFDKIERIQNFVEPDDPSWQACLGGQWEKSMALKESDRPRVQKYYTDAARRGIVARRVRVVEFPLSTYTHWELYVLNIRAQCGEKIKVIGPEAIAPYEENQSIPEIITFANRVMYEILYENGLFSGARRFIDPALINQCSEEMDGLYSQGEELESFFEANVKNIPPPGSHGNFKEN